MKLGSADHLSLSQAHDMVREIMSVVARGNDPLAERKALNAAPNLKDFITDYYGPWASTHLRSGVALSKRLSSAFSEFLNTRLSDISVFRVEKWRSVQLADRKAATTINRDVGALKAALTRAVEWSLIQENPLGSMKKLKVEDVTPPRYLKSDERERFLAAIENREARRIAERSRYNAWLIERVQEPLPDLNKQAFTDHLKPLILLSLNTGLRKNELLTLTWNNIHLDHPTPFLTVRAAFAKSLKSRHVQLNATAIETLRQWRSMSVSNSGDLVFVGKTGQKMDSIKSS